MEKLSGIWAAIEGIIPLSESREIVNSIGCKKIDGVQDLWREFIALEEITNELEGDHPNRQYKKIYIGDENDILQSIQSKLCVGKIDMVAEEIKGILSIEEEQLNKEISRCRKILDNGTDNILQSSAGNTPTNSARSQASDISDRSSSSGPLGVSRGSRNRCLSCGDKLLTSESTIKVPGAVRIKISDPNIAFCSSCQLVYHLDDSKPLRESQSQPAFKKINCVKDLASSSPLRHTAVDDNGLVNRNRQKINMNKTRTGSIHLGKLDSQKEFKNCKDVDEDDYNFREESKRGWDCTNDCKDEGKREYDSTPDLIREDGSFGLFNDKKLEESKARSSKFSKKIQNARDDHFFNDHDMF